MGVPVVGTGVKKMLLKEAVSPFNSVEEIPLILPARMLLRLLLRFRLFLLLRLFFFLRVPLREGIAEDSGVSS